MHTPSLRHAFPAFDQLSFTRIDYRTGYAAPNETLEHVTKTWGFQEIRTTPMHSAIPNQGIYGEFRSFQDLSMVGRAHRLTKGWSWIS
jgi:hypothetical protein